LLSKRGLLWPRPSGYISGCDSRPFSSHPRRGLFSGPRAGVSLKLPVFHITEPEIKRQIDPKIYQSEIALTEMALEVEQISEAIGEVRSRTDA
ncbi:MAG: hypothetical protein ACREQK_19180, partial [Candidatus Binatia bacterium]